MSDRVRRGPNLNWRTTVTTSTACLKAGLKPQIWSIQMTDNQTRIPELEREIEELEKEVAINPENYSLAGNRTPKPQDAETLDAWAKKREALNRKRQELEQLRNEKQ